MIPVQLTTNDHVGKTTEAHNKKKVKISKQRLEILQEINYLFN